MLNGLQSNVIVGSISTCIENWSWINILLIFDTENQYLEDYLIAVAAENTTCLSFWGHMIYTPIIVICSFGM